MTEKFVLIFCEGHHDVMFLYRLLKSHGYNNFSKKLKDFPYPLNDFLIREASNASIDELNIEQIKQRLIPTDVVFKDDNCLTILYAIGGDSKKGARRRIIDTVRTIFVSDPEAIQVVERNVDVSIIFFFDADNKGTAKRLEEINSEIQEIYKDDKVQSIDKNCSIVIVDGIKFGAYIFTEDGIDKGKLEDILLPMMESDNTDIFDEAKKFLKLNESVSLFKDHLIRDKEGNIIKVLKKDFDYNKSLIGLCGQLQISGKPNGVYIRESAYLNEDKLHKDKICNVIIDFLSSIIDTRASVDGEIKI